MSFYSYIKGILGIPNDTLIPRPNDEEGNEFRNPIWGDYTTDDEEEDFRSRRHGFGFRIFSDPIAIHQFFENEMEEMMRQFGRFGLDNHSIPGFDNDHNDGVFGDSSGVITEAPQNPTSLRDTFLKSGYTNPPANKEDVNLDGKVGAGDIDQLFESKRNIPANLDDNTTFSFSPDSRPRIYSKSIIVKTVRRPDGSIETRRTVRDNTGHEETTVTQQIPEGVDPSTISGTSFNNEPDLAGVSVFKKFFPFF